MSAALKIKRDELDATGLRLASVQARSPAAARRMLALAAVLDGHSREDAARLAGMDRQTLRDWVVRYNDQGLEGLYDQLARPKPRLLTPAQEAALVALIEAGPDLDEDKVVRWRLVDLRKVIGRRFGVTCHAGTISRLLRRLGLRLLVVRPHHPQRDLDSQMAFKKTSRA